MSCRTFAAVIVVLALARSAAAQQKFEVKPENAPPPKELSEPVRAVLDAKGWTVADEKGIAFLTIWPRKVLESKAVADKAQMLTYLDFDETVVVGAVQVR